MKSTDIEKRVRELEKLTTRRELPGTSITRVLAPGTGELGWCAGLGALGRPKCYGYGKTISEALEDAYRVHEKYKAKT